MENTKKKTFRELIDSDIVYSVKLANTEYIEDVSDIDEFDRSNVKHFDIYEIEEHIVDHVTHVTSYRPQNKYWDLNISMPCDKYEVRFFVNKSMTKVDTDVIDLTDNEEHLYDDGRIYVNKIDAQNHINELYEMQLKDANKIAEWYIKEIETLNKHLGRPCTLNLNVSQNEITGDDIKYIADEKKTKKNKKVALFPGSFNPFTIGHKCIVDKALAIFDEVIIAFGVNPDKDIDRSDLLARMNVVKKAYKGNKQIHVVEYQGLTMDLAKKYNATIVRGVRNTKDFEYEQAIAEANKKISGIETVVFVTDMDLSYISGTLIRELQKNGKDISNLIV